MQQAEKRTRGGSAATLVPIAAAEVAGDGRSSPYALPAAPDSFVGREPEVAELIPLVASRRLVTLTGPSGMGKTRLAHEVAAAAAAHFGDGAVLVELAPVSRRDDLARTVAAALRLPEQPGCGFTDHLVDYLAGRHLLLLLDNCEHVSAASSRLVDGLLRACPRLSVLATSQRPLGIASELVYPLLPLWLPGPAESHDTIMESPAVRLFAERAAAARHGFTVGPDAAAAVAEICRRLDGVPLAIELAAARIPVLSPAEIAARLDDRFSLLTGGSPAVMPRHQTLRWAIDWSHDLLPDVERVLLRRLSVFAGSFTLGAAEPVCEGCGLPRDRILDALTSLVARSLVVADNGKTPTRYRMLETIRQYARERLREAGEEADVRRHHGEWYMGMAERAELSLSGADQQTMLERLDDENDNLRAALDWAHSSGDAETGARLAVALVLFWRARGHLSEGLGALRRAFSAGEEQTTPELRARLTWGAGLLEASLGRFDRALRRADECLQMARHLEDARLVGRALALRGFAVMFLEDAGEALPILEEAAAVARDSGDAWCLVDTLARAGQAHLFQCTARAAIDCYEQCLEVALAAGHRQGLVQVLIGLGRAAVELGDHQRGEALLGQALPLARELGARVETAEALISLADLALERADQATAAAHLEECLLLCRDIPAPALTSRTFGGLGRLALARGDPERAVRHFHDSIALARDAGLSFVVSRGLLGLGSALRVLPDRERARASFEEALAVCRGIGDRRGTATALTALGRMARVDGDQVRSAALHHEALSLQAETGGSEGVPDSLDAIAGLAVAQGKWDVSARLWSAAGAIRAARGPYGGTPCGPCRQDDIAMSRELGREGFEAAVNEGRDMTVADAVAYASRGRGTRQRPASGWAGLTPTEHKVVELVAEGLTNVEVGTRLFISDRTVGSHLSHIFSKLAIASRRELIRLVRQRAAPESPIRAARRHST